MTAVILRPGCSSGTQSHLRPDSDTRHEPVDLRHHSLNTVVAHNKSLWLLPRQWTKSHLGALCVSWPRDAVADTVVDAPNPPRHAYLPLLPRQHLEKLVGTLTRGIPPEQKAVALSALLVSPEYWLRPSPPPGAKLPPSTVSAEHLIGADERAEPRGEGFAGAGAFFSGSGARSLKLAIGPRAYRLPRPTTYFLGPLILAYLDSVQIYRPRRHVVGGCLSNERYEPCIIAALVAMAQQQAVPEEDRATRLLFSHRDDEQYMHVYTARVSSLLLERFRHPNRTHTYRYERPQSLVEMRHERIPYFARQRTPSI
ncbi:hypothetical protein GGR56DRAFT_155015 [Xylariaceae sp. FL0804]|nr:hypothetical protein GGR56DRAFT_155015 [Xylariaceae sp. FL0804]